MPATPILWEPVTDGSAWTREEINADASWIYDIDGTLTKELGQAVDQAKRAGLKHSDLTAANFPLPSAAPLMESLLGQLEHRRGMAVVRGMPIRGDALDDCKLLLGGFVSHLGTSVVQDTAGTLIDYVADRGLSYESIAVRGPFTNAQLTPHCDSSDVVILLCIRKAKSGGINTLSSSLAIYNEILAHHIELLAPLYRGFYYNIRGNGPPGKYRDISSHRVPVFSFHEGRLSCRFNQKAILTSEQLPGVPPLTELEKVAVNNVADLAKDPRFSTDVLLEPGDLLFACNYTVLHNRSAFIDFDEAENKRLLLRTWINVRDGRNLTWEFGDHFATGIRQGPYVAGEPGQIVYND